MSSRLRAAYRSLMREARRLDSSPRVDAKRDISLHFRTAVTGYEGGEGGGGAEDSSSGLVREMKNAALLLRSQRIHRELLERYNPVHGMSQEERTIATAKRVGLNMPIERKPGDAEDS